MKLRKRLYAVIILLALVIVGLLLFVWIAGGIGSGGFTNPVIAAPQPAQSSGEAIVVLQTWIKDNWETDGAVIAGTLMLSKYNPKANDWTFQVYSKQKNRLLVATIQDQTVKVLRDITPPYSQHALPQTAWQQDSQTILKTWWQTGGSAAWRDLNADSLAMNLGLNADNIPTWQLTLSTDDLNALAYWEIRADTGALLKHEAIGEQP